MYARVTSGNNVIVFIVRGSFVLVWLPPITILLVQTSGTTKFPQNIGMKHPCRWAASSFASSKARGSQHTARSALALAWGES